MTILTDDEIAAIPAQDCAENYARAARRPGSLDAFNLPSRGFA